MKKTSNNNTGAGILALLFLAIFLMIFMSNTGSYVINDFVSVQSWEITKIEKGKGYYYRNFTTIDRKGDNVTFLWRTNNKSSSMLWEVSNGEQTQYQVWENCSVSKTGNKLKIRNRNRNHPDKVDLDIFRGPEINLSGAELIHNAEYGTKHFNYGVVTENKELILRPDEHYCFIIYDRSNKVDIVNYLFDWYEVDSDE